MTSRSRNVIPARRAAALALALALLLGAAPAPAARSLEVDVPAGWRIKPDETQLTLLPPKKSPFRQAMIFDQPFFLPPDVDALKLLAAAAFPEGSKDVRLTGQRKKLDGWTAVEVVGSATLVRDPVALGTYFVWKGTRMMHVVVLASGSDAEPARKMAEDLARSARLSRTATFLPVPGVPRGLIAPASWRPVKPRSRAFVAEIDAGDKPPAPPPSGTLRYEILPAGFDTPLPEVLKELDGMAGASGLKVTRTDGLETRVSGRPVMIFQQLLEPRALLLGAIIRFPANAVRITYLDRRERASERRAMMDQLIERVGETGVDARANAGSPAATKVSAGGAR